MHMDANFHLSLVVVEYLQMHILMCVFRRGMVFVDQVVIALVVLETSVLRFQKWFVFLLSIQTCLSF